jgi:nucleoside-diphosphate-sugar epimerase
MKVLVTGAPGWLGTRLVEVLIEKNYEVNCLVLKGVDKSQLEKLSVNIIEGDVTDKTSLDSSAKDVDTVIHCAGVIHPKKIKDLLLVNTEGTRNLLEASISNGVRKFIYISSNSAQGTNPNRNTLMTEYMPCKPYMGYGKSKFLAEQFVNDFYLKHKIKTVIIRPCWYYGPGQPARQTKLMKMIKKGKPLIFGNGKNLRSMTYIDNLVDGIIQSMITENAIGKTYWIADERPYTTLEIYQAIANALGVELKPRFIPGFVSSVLRVMDSTLQKLNTYSINVHVGGEMTENIACSIERAEHELGYKPRIDVKEGMRRSVEWAKENNLL